jgi:hypothetical protein
LNKTDYIVTEASAAPILDNTERCGIAADHSEMCKFESTGCQGFRDVVAALKRYCRSAPDVVMRRVMREREAVLQRRRDEAAEVMGICLPGCLWPSEKNNDALTRSSLRPAETSAEPIDGSHGQGLLDTLAVQNCRSQSVRRERILQ